MNDPKAEITGDNNNLNHKNTQWLVIKKDATAIIENEIRKIFKRNNIIEFE